MSAPLGLLLESSFAVIPPRTRTTKEINASSSVDPSKPASRSRLFRSSSMNGGKKTQCDQHHRSDVNRSYNDGIRASKMETEASELNHVHLQPKGSRQKDKSPSITTKDSQNDILSSKSTRGVRPAKCVDLSEMQRGVRPAKSADLSEMRRGVRPAKSADLSEMRRGVRPAKSSDLSEMKRSRNIDRSTSCPLSGSMHSIRSSNPRRHSRGMVSRRKSSFNKGPPKEFKSDTSLEWMAVLTVTKSDPLIDSFKVVGSDFSLQFEPSLHASIHLASNDSFVDSPTESESTSNQEETKSSSRPHPPQRGLTRTMSNLRTKTLRNLKNSLSVSWHPGKDVEEGVPLSISKVPVDDSMVHPDNHPLSRSAHPAPLRGLTRRMSVRKLKTKVESIGSSIGLSHHSSRNNESNDEASVCASIIDLSIDDLSCSSATSSEDSFCI